jgi:hypothetical protein
MAASGSKKDVDSDQITVNGATSFDSVERQETSQYRAKASRAIKSVHHPALGP